MTFKHWRLEHLGEYDDVNQVYLYNQYTVSELVTKYRLDRLLYCAKLRKIHWDGCRGYGDPRQNLHDLAAWVEGEFAKGNHHVETLVTWRN